MKQQNKSNAVGFWLNTHAVKMTAEQTLVIDSLSTLADAVATDLDQRTPINKSGEKDGFWFWKQWSVWFCDFCTKITELQCNVVLTCHEQEIRDSETGRVLGYKWILKGQDFSPRLSQFFTDVFRQTVDMKQIAGEKPKVEKTFKWQVNPDTLFPLCCTRIQTNEKYLPANYTSFKSTQGGK